MINAAIAAIGEHRGDTGFIFKVTFSPCEGIPPVNYCNNGEQLSHAAGGDSLPLHGGIIDGIWLRYRMRLVSQLELTVSSSLGFIWYRRSPAQAGSMAKVCAKSTNGSRFER